MFTKKFVPCIYLYEERAVKGLNDMTVVDTDPVRLARVYSENNADELIILKQRCSCVRSASASERYAARKRR